MSDDESAWSLEWIWGSILGILEVVRLLSPTDILRGQGERVIIRYDGLALEPTANLQG